MNSCPQILTTSNLNIFKILSCNRDINLRALKKIVEGIKEENALHAHPILVTSEMYVIDGQHRLEAAKSLAIPIYYIIDDSLSRKHIMSTNLSQKTWIIRDVLKFYSISDNNSDYTDMLMMMDRLNLHPKGLLCLLFGFQSSALIQKIKSGQFQLPKKREPLEKAISLYEKFIFFVDARRIKPRSMFTSFHFTQAIRSLVTNETFDEKVFFKKLEQRWFKLKPEINGLAWYKTLTSIYNYKNKERLVIDE